MILELEKFQNNKYSFFECIAEKKQSNGDWLQLEIKIAGTDIVLFNPWINTKKKSNIQRKRGGKKSYVKVYLEELNKLKEAGEQGETIGFALLLSPLIEWKTGLLRDNGKRGKPACTQEDISRLTNVSIRTARRRISDLLKTGIIDKSPDGYIINPDIIGKGV